MAFKMTTCQITGHPDTYGVGIRTAFYLQWFGIIITSWLHESDALNLKFLNALTIAATSAGLAVNLAGLQPSEIHAVLLLVCGALYSSLPLYIWRLATCCRPWWDPERWPRVRTGWLLRVSMMFMTGALLGFQLWFWCTGVHQRPAISVGCVQYGFLFGRLPLGNPGLIAVSITVHLAMLLVGMWIFAGHIGAFDECGWRRRRKRRWIISEDRAISLQQFQTICDIIVAASVVLAVELVISWNHIQGVNDLSSAAQLIPPVTSAAYLVRSVHLWLLEPDDGSKRNRFPDSPSGSGGGGTYTPSSNGSQPPRRRNMVYIGSSGRGRRTSHSHHHGSQRVSGEAPAMVDGRPDVNIIDVSPEPATPGSSYDSTASGQQPIAPSTAEMVDGDWYHQDHFYDAAAPQMTDQVPPADEWGYLPPEPPPVAASMHGGCGRYPTSDETYSPPVGGRSP